MIQTENDYNRDVFNGDLGVIEKINRIEQEMVVNFEGRAVEYDFGDPDELALAYVLSIHKSQGSEFPLRRDPGSHAALHDAPAEPALHGRHEGQAAGGSGGNEEGPGDGGEEGGYEPPVHGVEATVTGHVGQGHPVIVFAV